MQQYEDLIKNEIPFFGSTLKNQIKINPPLITKNKGEAIWNLRTSLNLDNNLMPSLFAPFRDPNISDEKYNKEIRNAYLLEERIFKIIDENGFNPKRLTMRNINKNHTYSNEIFIDEEDSEENYKILKPQNIANFIGYLPIENSKYLLSS